MVDQPTPDERPDADAIAAAWDRELPGVPTASVRLLTPLRRVAKRLADSRRRTLASLGVDVATLDLLSTLRRSGAPWTLTTRDLAARCLVSAGAISQRVARAEADGLVTRAPSAAGRRAVAVTLTEAGHALADQVVTALLAQEEAFVAALTDAEQSQLATILATLDRALDREARATGPDARDTAPVE